MKISLRPQSVGLLAYASFSFCVSAQSPPSLGSWQGVEIMGNKTAKRQDIEKIIGISIGSAATAAEATAFRGRCLEAKEKLLLVDAKCGIVMLPGGKVFFTVDVIERGEEKRLNFRSEKTFRKEYLPPEVMELLASFQALKFAKFQKGIQSEEVVKGEILDSSESELHAHIEKLILASDGKREMFFKVLEYSDDPKHRAAAATLLNWARSPANSIAMLAPYLNDPSPVVRNDISHFILKFLGAVNSDIVIVQLVEAFSKQLDFPSHGDRNKAIYALAQIAKLKPASQAAIKSIAGPSIAYLAENSILENVGGEAKKLMKVLQEVKEN